MATGALLGALAIGGVALAVPTGAEAATTVRNAASANLDGWTVWEGPYNSYNDCQQVAEADHIDTGLSFECADLEGWPGYANGWWVILVS